MIPSIVITAFLYPYKQLSCSDSVWWSFSWEKGMSNNLSRLVCCLFHEKFRWGQFCISYMDRLHFRLFHKNDVLSSQSNMRMTTNVNFYQDLFWAQHDEQLTKTDAIYFARKKKGVLKMNAKSDKPPKFSSTALFVLWCLFLVWFPFLKKEWCLTNK